MVLAGSAMSISVNLLQSCGRTPASAKGTSDRDARFFPKRSSSGTNLKAALHLLADDDLEQASPPRS